MTRTVTVVVGGTSGLGLEIAKLANTTGDLTFVLGRKYRKPIEGARFYQIDLLRPESALHFINDFGVYLNQPAITNLVFAAGTQLVGNVAEQEEDDILDQFTLVTSQFLMLRQVMLFAKRPFNVITIGSTTALTERKNETAYRGSKVLQRTLMHSVHYELTQRVRGCRQLIVHPGGMKTEFWKGTLPATYDAFMDPAEVAPIVLSELTFVPANGLREIKIPRPIRTDLPICTELVTELTA